MDERKIIRAFMHSYIHSIIISIKQFATWPQPPNISSLPYTSRHNQILIPNPFLLFVNRLNKPFVDFTSATTDFPTSLLLVHRLQHRARCLHTRQPTKHIQDPQSHPQKTTPSLHVSTKTSSTTPAISIPPALCHLRPRPSTPTSQKPTSLHPALQAL